MSKTPFFSIGQIVYLKIDAETPGMVTGILSRAGGFFIYYVTWSAEIGEVGHFEIELTAEKTFAGAGD